MFRKQDNIKNSNFPVSRPKGAPESYEEFLEQLEALFNGEDAEDFFDAIEKTPVRWQRKPELMILKAVGYLRAGDKDEAKKIFDEIERTHPKFAPLYYYKANLYMLELYPAHVLRMINKVRSLGILDDEAESSMNQMSELSTGLIKEIAEDLSLPYDKAEKASWHHEAGEEKLEQGKLQAAEQDTREVTRLAPNWTAPRNNHSYILYYLGRVSEAFAEAQAILSQYPNDLHALKNLIIFHTGINEVEKAREYAARLAEQWKFVSPESTEADTIISSLSLVDDHVTLWTIAQNYLKRDYEDLIDSSWYALAVAAVHTRHLKEAKKLLEKNTDNNESAGELLIEVRKAIKTGNSTSLHPLYSVTGLLLPAVILSDLLDMLGKYTDADQLPKHVQKKLDEYIQKRPFVINGLLHIMLEPGAIESISQLLLTFNQPEIDERLLAFALGDRGAIQQRLYVLSGMAQAGRKVPLNPVRLWNDKTGEWMEVDFSAQVISDDIELNISPEAAMWAEKAHEANNIEEKISFWKKAVEADPKSGYAVHALGIMFIQNKQKEEGKIIARRAMQVEPEYIFAYANNALLEAQEENPNVELIAEYLDRVAKAQVITTQTAMLLHVTRMMLAFDEDNFELARKEFEIASEIRPDDPLLTGWELRLKLSDVFANGRLSKWQEDTRKRAHQKIMRTKLNEESTAAETLNSLNREILGTTARIWGLTSYGKKAELVDKISARMQEAESVQYVLNKFNNTEKEALTWTLENNGSQPWDSFINKYGDDKDESLYWNYHPPTTVIGRLRHAGLLAKGVLNGEQVVFMPLELRDLIRKYI